MTGVASSTPTTLIGMSAMIQKILNVFQERVISLQNSCSHLATIGNISNILYGYKSQVATIGNIWSQLAKIGNNWSQLANPTCKLNLPHEHGGGLDEGQPGGVEEVVFGGGVDGADLVGVGVSVEHDVEAEAEGHDEEGVPEQEEEECLEDPGNDVSCNCETVNMFHEMIAPSV